ncbi:MAG: serine protease [Lachnospiraceae bacterium]|nr:serine protease [Lachnospiraceae bacterium]
MGNFTSIEKEFNTLIEPQINQFINTQGQNANPQAVQNKVNEIIQKTLLEMRISKMKELCDVTHRNLICYISAWLQSSVMNPEIQINDNDMNGLMNAVSGIEDRSIGLDIMLHTPGGVVTATESLVNYLRKMFDMDIRVIVPHMAMSAGTMIACSSKEIIMGKESSLGPIDPQYHNVPAQGVLKEFERAINETMAAPNKSLIWKEIIQQYRPTFVGECDNVVKMSYDLVEGWLLDCMFKRSRNKKEIVTRILDELSSHDASKVHDRHYDYVKCKKLGLKVSALEENQLLQDKVLSLYHCYLLSIYRLPSALKFIENHNGQTFVINGKR